MELCLCVTTVAFFDNRYFSANARETDQVKQVFAISKWKCTGRIVSTHLTGRFCASCGWFLVGPLVQCAGAFGSFFAFWHIR